MEQNSDSNKIHANRIRVLYVDVDGVYDVRRADICKPATNCARLVLGAVDARVSHRLVLRVFGRLAFRANRAQNRHQTYRPTS